jgi:hypothetical protein
MFAARRIERPRKETSDVVRRCGMLIWFASSTGMKIGPHLLFKLEPVPLSVKQHKAYA